MFEILNVVIPVFLILLASYLFGKKKQINIEPLIGISIYLAVPALVFTSILKQEFILKDFSMLFFSAIFVMVTTGIILLPFIKNSKRRGLYLPIMFMNSGNIGFPICLYAFGQSGLTQAVIYNIAASFIVFTLGVYIAAKKMNFKEIFRLPLIYSAVLGIVFAIYNISIPEIIFKPLDLVAQAAIPLQLIILGISLSKIRLKSFKIPFISSLARFGLGFGLALLFVSLFSITGLTKNIIILESIMPAALFSIILSQKYHRNEDLVASTVLISTLLSLLIIPLTLMFIQ